MGNEKINDLIGFLEAWADYNRMNNLNIGGIKIGDDGARNDHNGKVMIKMAMDVLEEVGEGDKPCN